MYDDCLIMIYSIRLFVSCIGENNIKVIWGMLFCSCEWSLYWMLIYLMFLVLIIIEDWDIKRFDILMLYIYWIISI